MNCTAAFGSDIQKRTLLVSDYAFMLIGFWQERLRSNTVHNGRYFKLIAIKFDISISQTKMLPSNSTFSDAVIPPVRLMSGRYKTYLAEKGLLHRW